MLRVIPRELATLEWMRGVITADLRRPLPFPSASAECIYASHVLEHLYEDEARSLLAECVRVLKVHGVLRIVVPDLSAIVRQYAGDTASTPDGGRPRPADWLNEELRLRPRSAPRGHLLYRLYQAATDFHTHKWMYDAESLIGRLEDAGFADVEQRSFRNSRIQAIGEIERPDRVLEGELYVEGVKGGRIRWPA